jgi:hypothetical protein
MSEAKRQNFHDGSHRCGRQSGNRRACSERSRRTQSISPRVNGAQPHEVDSPEASALVVTWRMRPQSQRQDARRDDGSMLRTVQRE